MSIAMLSWGYHETLIRTLDSYREFGLDELFEEKVIFFQEYSKRDKEIAKEYGYDSFGSPENIGIAEAYKLLAAAISGDYFLFLENDWKLLEDPASAILDGFGLLQLGMADIVRYRHRWFPGNPLWTRQFEGHEYDKASHLLDAIHWSDMEHFPEVYPLRINDNLWYQTTAKNANWTNNPHMAHIDFIRDNIVPRLGDRDIEKDIQSWWHTQDFKVAQGQGLFTHERGN